MPVKIRKDHAHELEKGIAKKALKAARELEQIPQPRKEEIVRTYKDALEEAKRLHNLLESEWFVRDVDTARTAGAGRRKAGKRRK